MRMKTPTTDTLRLDAVTITLDGHTLIEISAEVAPGDVLTVMGPSGSGQIDAAARALAGRWRRPSRCQDR
jgi:ABC-type uncharacterized transport system YnjBCD ATPase subunit